MAPLLGPRVTPVPWGLQRSGESGAVSEKGLYSWEASCQITRFEPGGTSPSLGRGGLGPPWLLCQGA